MKYLQGDVVRILNTSGTTVVAYSYDAWGKCTVTTGASNAIANANPIRYRGYYYDTDTSFYYLQSRYYDPTIKRFINADSSINANGDFLGFNMYAYTNNNSISFSYSNSSVAGSDLVSSNRMTSTVGHNAGNSHNYIPGYNFPDLSFLSNIFSFLENRFSLFVGIAEGYYQFEKLDNLTGLKNASLVLTFVGIGLNVRLSAYESFLVNHSQSPPQKIANFVGDIAYIAVSSAATYGIGYLVGVTIPYAGPFLAVPASLGAGEVLDRMWNGENIFWFNGININGQSLEEWFKDLLTNWFGG